MPQRMTRDARIAAHARLAAELTYLDDRELRRTLTAGKNVKRGGWGTSSAATVGESSVFVKQVPLTDKEHATPFSTRNRYRLPVFYSYGVGSAGFGAWRELAAHVTTTAMVVAGECDAFPLLHHWRVMRRSGSSGGWRGGPEYVRHWAGREAVGRFIEERADGNYELWLVLEHFAHTMDRRVFSGLSDAETVIVQLFGAIDALRRRDIVHFDAHFGNVVTDGQQHYLTDYGLLLDRRFHLTAREEAFRARHAHYDYGEVLYSIAADLMWAMEDLTEERLAEARNLLGIQERGRPDGFQKLVDGMPRLREAGFVAYTDAYGAAIGRYRDAIVYFATFIQTLRANPRKDTIYEDDHLAALLADAGAPIGDL